MKTHRPIETILLLGGMALILVISGLARRSPGNQSMPPLDPNHGRGDYLASLLASSSGHREHKPLETLEGQFNDVTECSDAVLRHVLGATDEQWQQIEPRFRELEAVHRRTCSAIGLILIHTSSHSGGSSNSSSKSFGTSAIRTPNRRRSGGQSGSIGRSSGGWRTSRDGDRRATRRGRRSTSRSRSGARDQTPSPWWRPSPSGGREQLGEGLQLCETLLDLIESPTAQARQIQTTMAQLAAYRQEADREIQAAQEALRQVVTPRQEATFILMGYLD